MLFFSNIIASSLVLNHSGLLDIRTIQKVQEIGNEVKAKLGVNIYVDVKGNNGVDLSLPMKKKIALIKQKEKELTKNLQKPFVLLALSLDQMYVNILFSDDKLSKIIDKDDILNDYVIPLIASKDKNNIKSKISAAILNGYSEIADRIAKYKGVKLKNNIGGSGHTAAIIWKIFIYIVVATGLVMFAMILRREKKE